jgi:hypothetical protein
LPAVRDGARMKERDGAAGRIKESTPGPKKAVQPNRVVNSSQAPNCAPVRRGAKSQQHEAAEKLLRSIGLRVELFGRSKNSLAAMGLQAQSRNLL